MNNKVLTNSLEDYLEIIYIIHKNSGCVRVTDIANKLRFSKASVTRAVNNLKSQKLVTQERYGQIILTALGIETAKLIYERHKILSDFFVKILGVDSYTAEIDACKAEHILSSKTIENIKFFLNKSQESHEL